MATLLAALLCTLLAALAVTRIEPSQSLEPLFASDDPAAEALFSQLNDYAAAEDLLLLVSVPDEKLADRPAEVSGQGGGRVVDEKRLTDFAGRLERAISRDPKMSGMVSAVAWRADEQASELARRVIAPNLIYYLDEQAYGELATRLSTEGIREQVRRNEALMAAPSLPADVLARQLLKDPLRFHELLLDSLDLPEGMGLGGIGGGAFLSEDGRSLLIRVSAARPASDMDFTKRFMSRARQVVEQAHPGGLDVGYAGAYAIAELSECEIRRDMISSIVSAVVLLQVLFLIVYRRLTSFPVAFIPVAAGILWGVGLFSLRTTDLTPITAVVGCMLAGLGIDYCIHYLSHHEHRGGHNAGSTPEADTSRGVAMMLLGACGTTVVAFGTIEFSESRALRDFAVLGVLGILCVFLSSLTVLPAMLAAIARLRRSGARPGGPRIRFDRLIEHVSRHAHGSLTLMLCLFVCCVMIIAYRGGRVVEFESDMHVMHPQPNPPLQTQARIADRFSRAGPTLTVYLRADDAQSLLTLAHRVRDKMFTERARQASVLRTFGIASLLPDPSDSDVRRRSFSQPQVARIVDDFRDAIRDSAFSLDAYADYIETLPALLRPGAPPPLSALLDYEGVTQLFLPRAVFEREHVPLTQAVTHITLDKHVVGQTPDGQTIEALRDLLSDIPGATLTGMDVLSYDLRQTTKRDLAKLSGFAVLAVLVWLTLLYRKPTDVLLMLVPTVFSMTVLVTYMWVMGIRLNMINIVALPLLAGIGVDDGIFLVSLARQGRPSRDGVGPLQRFAPSCHAITMTSVTTAIAFGSLWFTSTPAIRSLGHVMAVGIAGCWAGSLFLLLPLLLMRFSRGHALGGAS